MAIVGTFEADFSQFTSAVRGAETQLKSLESNSSSIAGTIDRVGGSLGKLAGAFGIAFSVGSVVNFGRELLRTADQLQELHDRTGLSTDALQRFQAAGADAGNTIDQLARGAVQLQDRIAGNDRSALKALEFLNIALKDFKALRPEDQMEEVARAIGRIGSSSEQIRIVNDLFGRMGQEILPTLKRGFDDLEDTAILSGSAITTLDSFGDSLGKAYQFMKLLAAESLAFSIKPYQDIAGLFQDLTPLIERSREQAELLGPKMAAIAPPGLPDDLATITRELTNSAEAMIKVNTQAAEAAKKLKALQDLARNRTLELLPLKPKDVEIDFEPEGAYKRMFIDEAGQREWQEAQDQMNKDIAEGAKLLGEMGQKATEAGAAGVLGATQATSAYDRLAASIQSVTSAYQVNVPAGFNYAQAYSDAGFFVHDSPFLGLSKPNQPQNLNQASLGYLPRQAAYTVPTITVNVDGRNSFYESPQSQQQLGDIVGSAVQSRLRSMASSVGTAA